MNDLDADGTRLLAPLRELRPTPSGVDLAVAVRRGRRRYHALRLVQMGGAAGLTTVVAATATFALDGRPDQRPDASSQVGVPVGPSRGLPASCTVATLPSPLPGARTLATAVDPTGRFVVGRAYPDGAPASGPSPAVNVRKNGRSPDVVVQAWGHWEAVIWDKGTPSLIDAPGEFLEFDAVNGSGVAVGSAIGANGESAAVVYRNRTVSRLAGGAAAMRIGEDGRIVGRLGEAAGSGIAVWATPDADPTPLGGVPEGWVAHVSSVARDGTIVGSATPPPVYVTPTDVENLPRHVGYLWRTDGTVTRLPVPTLPGREVIGFSATALDGDRVFGVAYVQGKERSIDGRFVRVDLRTGAATEYAEDAQAVEGGRANARGWFAGSTGDSRGGTPAIATPTVRIDLPALPGLGAQMAMGIDDDASVVVGQGYDLTTNAGHALVWNCRP